MGSSKQVASIGTLIVVVHLGVVLQHGFDHAHLAIDMATWQNAFVGSVIVVAPVVAAVMLRSRRAKPGLWLLAVSMAGSFFFGLCYHFLAAGPDNVFAMAPGGGNAAFQITAVLLAVIEAVGVCWSLWTLRSKPDEDSRRGRKQFAA